VVQLCGEETHSGMYTDKLGVYSFKGVWDTVVSVSASKDGFADPAGQRNGGSGGDGWRAVTINGDTQFNIHLARK